MILMFSLVIVITIIFIVGAYTNSKSDNLYFEKYQFIGLLPINTTRVWAISFGKTLYKSTHHINSITNSKDPLSAVIGIQGSNKSRAYVSFNVAKQFLLSFHTRDPIIIKGSKYIYVKSFDSKFEDDEFNEAHIIILKNVETNEFAYLQFHRYGKTTDLIFNYE